MTEMVDRLRATHALPGRLHWVVIAPDIGWIRCPRCMLPFQSGKRLLYDNVTHRGVCDDCGKQGLAALQGEVTEVEVTEDPPF